MRWVIIILLFLACNVSNQTELREAECVQARILRVELKGIEEVYRVGKEEWFYTWYDAEHKVYYLTTSNSPYNFPIGHKMYVFDRK